MSESQLRPCPTITLEDDQAALLMFALGIAYMTAETRSAEISGRIASLVQFIGRQLEPGATVRVQNTADPKIGGAPI